MIYDVSRNNQRWARCLEDEPSIKVQTYKTPTLVICFGALKRWCDNTSCLILKTNMFKILKDKKASSNNLKGLKKI